MRTRTRTTSSTLLQIPAGTYGYSFVACDGSSKNGTISEVALNQLTSYTQETMKDSLGRKQSHPVQHWKTKVACVGGGSYQLAATDVVGGVTKYGVTTYAAPDYLAYSNALNHQYCVDVLNATVGSLGNGWSIGSLGVSEESLKNDCLESANRLEADVLLNLVEANQMWPAIKSLSSSWLNLAKHWKQVRKFVRTAPSFRKDVRDLTRTASGAFLAWKFGVSPFLHDVMAIDRGLRTMSDRFRKHEKEQPVRSSRVAQLNATFVGIPFGPSSLNGYETWKFTHTGRCTRAPALRFVLVTKPIVPYSIDLFKKMDFAMRRFATSPASLAWELVPFSFVVDWFIDVRSALNAVDKMLGVKPFQIINFTRSLSYTLCNDTSVVRSNPCNGGVLYGSAMGSTERSYYERSLVASQGIMPKWRPRFGKNQAAISVALISQALSRG